MQHLLLAAAVLVCPIGVGAMMWMMMRSDRGANADREEVCRLRAEIEQLKSGRDHNN